MKSYKLEIKSIIFIVAVLSIFIFSAVLISLHLADLSNLGELLLHYGLLIAPITLMWVLIDNWMWHTRFLQSLRKQFKIAPDIRGRWEGELNSSQFEQPHKFVIEIKQSLTSLHVYSYSSIGHSSSILVDIASDENEDGFMLCFLWQGEVPTTLANQSINQKFNGYTMLKLEEAHRGKSFVGTYFTDHKPTQTAGTIHLHWKTLERKRKL